MFVEFQAPADVFELLGMLLKESSSEIVVFKPYNRVYYFVEFVDVFGIAIL